MHRRQILKLALAGGAGLTLEACAAGGGAGGGAASGTVVDVARSRHLGRFLAALDAAGLTAYLEGPGPFTVFAPSDRAFAAARLPRDPEALGAILRYHIVPGTFTTEFLDLADMNYTTAGGASLNVDGTEGLTVDGARVTTADLAATNGVVHIIDRVLTPG